MKDGYLAWNKLWFNITSQDDVQVGNFLGKAQIIFVTEPPRLNKTGPVRFNEPFYVYRKALYVCMNYYLLTQSTFGD